MRFAVVASEGTRADCTARRRISRVSYAVRQCVSHAVRCGQVAELESALSPELVQEVEEIMTNHYAALAPGRRSTMRPSAKAVSPTGPPSAGVDVERPSCSTSVRGAAAARSRLSVAADPHAAAPHSAMFDPVVPFASN